MQRRNCYEKNAMVLTSLAPALGLTACSGQQGGESSVNSTNSVAGESEVRQSSDDASLRTVELVNSTVSDWETYETVFIGYPIWWGIAAWSVDGFISENDFSGKTVIPFRTSSGSGLGDSGKLLAEAAGEGNRLDGIRFRSRESEDTVKSRVQGLGL